MSWPGPGGTRHWVSWSGWFYLDPVGSLVKWSLILFVATWISLGWIAVQAVLLVASVIVLGWHIGRRGRWSLPAVQHLPLGLVVLVPRL